MLNLDSDSNLWVAGSSGLTKVFTDPAAITDGIKLASTPASLALKLSKPAHDSIKLSLITAPGYTSACTDAAPSTCCSLGSWDAGIAITRDTPNKIYVANACVAGLVSG